MSGFLQKQNFIGQSDDISDGYVTLDPLTTATTITSGGSVVIPVNATGGSFAVTLNDNVPVNTRARIHDSYEQCGTNPVTIKNGSDVVIGKLNTDGGAVEFAWAGATWMKIDRFENMLDRDEITGEVKLREALDTFVAGKMRTPVENLAGSVAGGGFTNAEANVDVGSGDFGNANVASPAILDGTQGVAGEGSTESEANLATDGVNTSTVNLSPSTHGLQYDLGEGNTAEFSQISVTRTGAGINNQAFPVKIEGSVDGIQWFDVAVDNDFRSQDPEFSENNYTGWSGSTDEWYWTFTKPSTPYRHWKFFLNSTGNVSGRSPTSGAGLQQITPVERNPSTTLNTIESTSALGSGSYIPSTLVLNDENALPISGAGKVNVAYAVDGGAFSSLVDLETFRADPTINYTSQFQLRLQAVGSQRVSSYSIEAPATYSEMTQDGMETYVDGQLVSRASKDGLVSPSGVIGQAGIVSDQSVADGDFANAGVNVDLGASDFGNGTGGTEATKFNDGNESTDDNTPYAVSTTAGANAFRVLDGNTGTWWTAGSGNTDATWLLDLGVGQSENFGSVEFASPAGVITTTFVVEGSNDNSNFDELLSFTGSIGSAQTSPEQNFTATGHYRYYRVSGITTNLGYPLIAELNFYRSLAATTLNTIDTNLATAASGTFTPSSFKAYDENGTLISGSGKVNVGHAIDGGGFVAEVDQDTFKALGNLAYSSQFDLRLQAVGAQRISRIEIATPDQIQEVGSDGSVTYKEDGVKYAKIGPTGFEITSKTTAERDALSVPASTMIYNSTTNKMNFYNGSAWEELTSS
jgi:hypothetical protein